MKKLKLVFAALSVLAIAGCSSTKNETVAGKENLPTVAFLQIISSAPLDETRKGYLRGLEENGFKDGVNFKFEYENAEGDIATAQLIAREFASRNVAVLGASSSPALQSAMKATEEIPIVFCGVADPASAGAIEDGKQVANVTGVSNPDPIEKSLDLLKELMPQVKVIGTLYDPSEPYIPLFRERSRVASAKLGMQRVEVSVNSSNNITSAVQALKARGVEAIMQLPSNVTAAGAESQIDKANDLGIPYLSTHPGTVALGGLAALGWDYEQAGYEAGVYAAQVLKGKKTSELPIKSVQKEDLVINLPVAAKFGVKIPKAVLDRADKVIR